MAYRYDITVRVNLTMEYEEEQRPSDVKEDAHMLLNDFDDHIKGLHAWACEAEGGRASLIDHD
jgi:hypothetical protein